MNTFCNLEDDLISNYINKSNYVSGTKSISCQDSYETSLSYNNTNNDHIAQNKVLYITQNIENTPTFKLNFSQMNNDKNNVQHIVLKSLQSFKKENSSNNINNKENKNNVIQHIILKSLKKYKNKEEKIQKLDNVINENDNNYTNLLINTSIMRLISSNEKIIPNFPVEYLNEMMSDICINLYKPVFDEERKKLLYNNNFIKIRTSLFNFILHLSMNSPISEGSIFLTYDIFDRYVSIKKPNNDNDLLLIIITSFAIAIKYIESSIPNLDDLNAACGNRFSKELINKCELNIMEHLDYNISIPTILDLLQFIIIIKNMTPKEYNLSLFIFEILFISGLSLKYNYLIIIEAVYLLVLETGGKDKKNLNLYNYFKKFEKEIDINKYNNDVNICLFDIKNECSHIKENNFDILIKKFASDKYQNISADFHLL